MDTVFKCYVFTYLVNMLVVACEHSL